MALNKKQCLQCNTSFETTNKELVFCSAKCRSANNYEKVKMKRDELRKQGNPEKYFRYEDFKDGIF